MFQQLKIHSPLTQRQFAIFHIETNHDAGGFEFKFVFVISTIIAIFATNKQGIINNTTRNRETIN